MQLQERRRQPRGHLPLHHRLHRGGLPRPGRQQHDRARAGSSPFPSTGPAPALRRRRRRTLRRWRRASTAAIGDVGVRQQPVGRLVEADMPFTPIPSTSRSMPAARTSGLVARAFGGEIDVSPRRKPTRPGRDRRREQLPVHEGAVVRGSSAASPTNSSRLKVDTRGSRRGPPPPRPERRVAPAAACARSAGRAPRRPMGDGVDSIAATRSPAHPRRTDQQPHARSFPLVYTGTGAAGSSARASRTAPTAGSTVNGVTVLRGAHFGQPLADRRLEPRHRPEHAAGQERREGVAAHLKARRHRRRRQHQLGGRALEDSAGHRVALVVGLRRRSGRARRLTSRAGRARRLPHQAVFASQR